MGTEVIVGWGILVAANASRVFGSDDDEERIRREMDRLKKQDRGSRSVDGSATRR